MDKIERGADDAVGVDAVVAVHVVERTDLPEPADAECGSRGHALTPVRNARVCGWPSRTVTIGAARPAGNTLSRIQDGPSASPRRACTASNSRPGLVTHTTSAAMSCSARRSAAARVSVIIAPIPTNVTTGSGTVAVGTRRRRPAGGGVREPPGRLAPRPGSDRPGRVDRRRYDEVPSGRPSRPMHAEQRPLDIDGERRFVADTAGLLEADRRGLDRLMRAALGGEGDPGRGADQDRLPAGVDAVRPRLQGAFDERVVQHADRE